MIKARTKGADGHPVIILGLGPSNLLRLTGDEPIPVRLAELGLDTDIEVVIVGPGSLEKMAERGLIPGVPE
jgi:hypothetical protein